MSRVKLHYRLIANGKMKSVYLEYNPCIKDVKGKSIRYECLNLELYTNPSNDRQIDHNNIIEEIAETIRCKRYIQLVQHDFNFLPKARLDEDFLEYFRINGDCHGAKYKSSRLHFEQFCEGHCTFKDINASLCERFRLHLLHAKGLYHFNNTMSKNSAAAYFNAFLSIIKLAFKDNILAEDYTLKVEKITWDHDKQKEYLTSSEIKQLESCYYDKCPELYVAGMFAIYTGLRRSDILTIRWENIHFERGRKAYMKLTIKKTGTEIQLPLTLHAVKVLGLPKKTGKIFPTLNINIINTHLSKWISMAKINKRITFHCFRHTFAMQMVNKGIDIYTISALLGHRQVTSTQNYAKITPKKILEAILMMEK